MFFFVSSKRKMSFALYFTKWAWEVGANCIARRVVICNTHQILTDQMKKDVMDGA